MSENPQLYQIIYNEDTLAARDPDFQILDNLDNLRPDWSEYWPIRRFLLNNPIEDTTYYGFFSPKFFQKTGIHAKSIKDLLQSRGEDVVIFSPYLEVSALFLNQIEQGNNAHPSLLSLFADLFPRKNGAPALVQDTLTTIYSNYFIATGRFWRAWLRKCEPIFQIAEAQHSSLGLRLCHQTIHDGKPGYQLKVFLIERIAGLMLADDAGWTRAAPLAYQMPLYYPQYDRHRDMLIFLDLLKSAARRTGDYDFYIKTYRRVRKDVFALLREVADDGQ